MEQLGKRKYNQFSFEALKQGFKGVDTACQPKHYREDLVGLGLLKAYEVGIKGKIFFFKQNLLQ